MKILWVVFVVVCVTCGVKAEADAIYLEKFKGKGKLTAQGGFSVPKDPSVPSQDFFGAIKRVVHADKNKGVDLQLFVWEKTLGTWSAGFYFGFNLSSQAAGTKAKSVDGLVTLRHFSSKELNVAISGNSADSMLNLEISNSG